MVPNSVTLNDLERRNSLTQRRNFTEFGSFFGGLPKMVELYTPIFSAAQMQAKESILAIYHLWRYWQGITPSEKSEALGSRQRKFDQ